METSKFWEKLKLCSRTWAGEGCSLGQHILCFLVLQYQQEWQELKVSGKIAIGLPPEEHRGLVDSPFA